MQRRDEYGVVRIGTHIADAHLDGGMVGRQPRVEVEHPLVPSRAALAHLSADLTIGLQRTERLVGPALGHCAQTCERHEAYAVSRPW